MSSIIIAVAISHFLAGLALFTLAGMAVSALGRSSARQAVAWGLLATIALGMAEWCDLAVGRLARPLIWQLARVGLEMVALVGLIELGRLCTTGPRIGLLPRWSYVLVAAAAVAARMFAQLVPLEFALRLVIVWQAGWLAANYLARGKNSTAPDTGDPTIAEVGSGTPAAQAIVGGLLIYLTAACVAVPVTALVTIAPFGPRAMVSQATFGGPLAYLLAACTAIPLPGMLAALVALAAAYLAFGARFEHCRQSKLRWHCAWPIGFVLVAVCGCFVLAAACAAENELLLAQMAKSAASDAAADQASADAQANDSGDADEMEAVGARANVATETAAVRQAKRIGIGLSPIIVFVLLIWGLSRLPFVH